jgi:tryptophan synthase beta chain
MERFGSRRRGLLPARFLNIKPLLPSLPGPPLHPATRRPLEPSDLEGLFPSAFVEHEATMDPEVPIPGRVLEAMETYRPTPLVRASALERYLGTTATIFYKYEGVSPTGSHKSNTALVQAFLAASEGVETLVTETGAGQWGSALAHAGARFGIEVRVFMVRSSSRQKPGRKTLIEMFGGSVHESPSPLTRSGSYFFGADQDHPGSLGIAISEAVEQAMQGNGAKYALGSVLDAVMLHQSVIGQEALSQMSDAGVFPDVVIGCVGGGSNFAGLAFPLLAEAMKNGSATRFVAVEPESCPSLTGGELRYDNGDAAGLTPLLYMHTLGREFIPPPIHAGGLRYHGMAPLVSHLVSIGKVEATTVSQEKAFDAARIFLQTEGVLPAPESSHAAAVAIREALAAKESGARPTILFNMSGHGLLDISAFEKVVR